MPAIIDEKRAREFLLKEGYRHPPPIIVQALLAFASEAVAAERERIKAVVQQFADDWKYDNDKLVAAYRIIAALEKPAAIRAETPAPSLPVKEGAADLIFDCTDCNWHGPYHDLRKGAEHARCPICGSGRIVSAKPEVEAPEEVLKAVADRDDSLLAHQPKCPKCGTGQVQIIGKSVPASWKCRLCSERFYSEPSPATPEKPYHGPFMPKPEDMLTPEPLVFAKPEAMDPLYQTMTFRDFKEICDDMVAMTGGYSDTDRKPWEMLALSQQRCLARKRAEGKS